ncbi:hypothetical protein G6F61_008948 [Rhizopus arrhizus]|nr:hypothetical protein G6F61_008948 [Rhizopus arrhizus]
MSAYEAFSLAKKLNNVTSRASQLFQHYNLRTNSRYLSTSTQNYQSRNELNKAALPAIKPERIQIHKAFRNATHLLEAKPSSVFEMAHALNRSKIQSRTLFSNSSSSTSRIMNYRRLNKLEQEANSFPQDATKQATLYKEWLRTNNPHAVIARFERGDFVQNEACWQYYIAALAQTGKADLIWTRILQKLEQSGAKGLLKEKGIPKEMIQQAIMANTRQASEGAIATGGNKANPIYVIVEEARKFMFWKALRWVGVTLTYAFCILTILSLALENSGLLKPATTQTEYEPVTQTTVKFEDVQGVDEAKQELEEIVEFLKNPQRFTELGGKLPKGVLLTGPPGTGKTMLARAVAGEANVPFFFMSGSEFDEMYVGVGARRVRELFAAARAKAPSIVFIDEIDAIGSKRNPKDQSYMKQTLNQLLVDLDGFSQTEGVIFIAATNFPELLDKALVRPGRFDRLVNVPLPDVRGRIEILKHHMRKMHVASEVDISVIARGTPGFSGADLANLVNLAAIQASRESSKEINLRHLEHSKDKIIMGAERRSAVITDESKKLTAYHEGGHALVAYYTPGAMPLHKATIMPRGSALGMTVQLPEMDKDSFTKKEFIAQIDVCMGGRVAEELIFGEENVTSGAHSDIVKATDVAKRMVRYYGMSDKVGAISFDNEDMQLLSAQTKQLIESEISELVESSQARAKRILTEHRDELDRLANALVEYETLDAQEIIDVLTGKPITRSAVPISNEQKIEESCTPALAESIQQIQMQCYNLYDCLKDLQEQHKTNYTLEERTNTIDNLCNLAKTICEDLKGAAKSANKRDYSQFNSENDEEEEDDDYSDKQKDYELIRQARNNQRGYKYYRRNKLSMLGHKCHSCRTTETPEWRRGPDGARTLCNACGLHYSKLLRKGAIGVQTENYILSSQSNSTDKQNALTTPSDRLFPGNYPFILIDPKYGFNTRFDKNNSLQLVQHPKPTVAQTGNKKQFRIINNYATPTHNETEDTFVGSNDANNNQNMTSPLRIYQWKQ